MLVLELIFPKNMTGQHSDSIMNNGFVDLLKHELKNNPYVYYLLTVEGVIN